MIAQSRFSASVATWISNLLVLGVLGGIGYWGHRTHWKFVAAHPDDGGHSHVERAAEDARLAAQDGRPDESDTRPVTLQSAQAAENSGLEYGTVEEACVDEYISVNGVVTYDQTLLAQLSARVPGAVWRVEKEVGEEVKKGDVLAILDAIEVGKAKSEFMQAFVDNSHKSNSLTRLRKSANSIPERTIREAEAAFRTAHFRMFHARHALLNLGLPLNLSEQESLSLDELSKHLHFLGLPESVTSQLDPETTPANLIPLVAPFDGVVIGREIVTGEVVHPEQPQFTIADVSRMWLRLDVRREDAHRISIGQDIVFVTDGTSSEISTQVSWIGTEVDEKTRTVQVRAEFENPLQGDGHGTRWFRANAFGTGRIRIGRRPNALVVPTESVQFDGLRRLVFLPDSDGKTFKVCAVELGTSQKGQMEVTGDLKPGERIVTEGSHLLKSEIMQRRLAGD